MLDKDHPSYDEAAAFRFYFATRGGSKDKNDEDKFEKGFKKMLLTHMRLANDPDDCYLIDNAQVSWYYNEACMFKDEVFTKATVKAVKDERHSQFKKISYLCECIEWAWYYQNIQSKLYVVSAGSEQSHLTAQIVIGIMIACKWHGIKCKLALTNNECLKEIAEVIPKVVRDYVDSNTEIWYLNNFDGFNNFPGSQPFFTVDPCYKQNMKLETFSRKSLSVPFCMM